MYKKLSWILLLFITASAGAQISMTLQVPPEGLIQKPQLWNFVVANGLSSQTQVKVTMTMKDAVTNDPIMTGTSGSVYVSTGATVLTAMELAPIQYDYLSPRVTDIDPNGFLPIGNFTVCYKLYASGHIGFDEVSEECINVYVEPLSPPLLSLPFDGSEEEINMPQFSWIPPAPLNMFNNLSYDFLLVEVGQGQTPQEAIQQNMPVYTVSNHPDIFINYPSSGTPLDTGKMYAWQVIANNNNDHVGQSEVWTFKVRPDSIITTNIPKLSFVKLSKNLDASVGIVSHMIRFYYNNEAADTTVSYTISSLDNANIGAEIRTESLSIKKGENYIQLPLSGDDRLVKDKIYLFSILNTRNEIWMLKFVYQEEQ
ncbi:hypothetical protein I5907_12420 [Panacibacter sp. DH6]|uniref:DUF928 domain-containing protein n=1 Tax=Panacibacter microcysteis TaxID=2793269 RepID=A0A931EAX0_9BACT|nr:hypothetical protein [Panacibacter microcysteis]MBG9377041.1 hypothetical protein [Panacibacter microcysteis]